MSVIIFYDYGWDHSIDKAIDSFSVRVSFAIYNQGWDPWILEDLFIIFWNVKVVVHEPVIMPRKDPKELWWRLEFRKDRLHLG